MADVEKVKKGLECCSNHDCDNCPYEEQRECHHDNLFDQISEEALSVINQQQAEIDSLKAEQPKEPMQLKYSETREEYWFYESICPMCGNRWISNGTDHFCPACGQPVFEPCEEEHKDGEQE